MKRWCVIFCLLGVGYTVFSQTPGSLSGLFSVSASTKVRFSQGNLQYQASTNTWRFATNQYDCIGKEGNEKKSSTYSGWVDLFGWGTSGYTIKPYTKDGVSGAGNSIAGTKNDWGVYNAISNGGNKANIWRTLTHDEWVYLLTKRTNAGSKKALATVNSIHGVIILPDSWTLPSECTFTAGIGNGWSTNVYTLDLFRKMEQAGAVFFPAAGRWYMLSSGLEVVDVQKYGFYWSTDKPSGSSNPYNLGFQSTVIDPDNHGMSYERGKSVRLVQNSTVSMSFTLTTKASPTEGGTVTTGGSIVYNTTKSITATPKTGYKFSKWTVSGTGAKLSSTTDATTTFTMGSANATVTATFVKQSYTLTTSASPTEGGTVTSGGTLQYQATKSLTATPKTGYKFSKWTVSGTGAKLSSTTDATTTFTMGSANATVTATFTPINYQITVNSTDVSMGSASGGGSYAYNTSQEITATPNLEYQFEQWNDGNTDNPRSVLVTGNATYTAFFSFVGHNYGAPTYVWNADSTQCTATRICNNDASHVETETVNSNIATTNATCESTGLITYTAEFVNSAFSTQTATKILPALGHVVVIDEAVAPTCTETGLTEGSHCSRCHATLVAQNVVDALGHVVVTDEAVEPTCTETGLTEGSHCSRCHATLVAQNTVDALGHVVVTDEAVAPTCTETGLTAGNHCSRCHATLVAQNVVDALGHDYGAPTYVWNADSTQCTATRICGNDASHVESETVTSNIATTNATCEETGLVTYTAEFTNVAFAPQTATKVLPALGHDYGAPTYVWNSDSTQCTATRVCLHDAGEIETETVSKTSVIVSEPTCTNNGLRRHTVAFVNEGFTTQSYDEVIAQLEQTTNSITESSYGNFTLNGQTYTESGVYTQILPNSHGCDSVLTINLTVIKATDLDLTVSEQFTTCEYRDVITIESYSNGMTFTWELNGKIDNTQTGDFYRIPQTAPLSGTIKVTGTIGGVAVTKTIQYAIYKEIARQMWDDVVSIVNPQHEFISYEWYHNDKKISIEEYYNERGGVTGTYYVIATNKAGEKIHSCILDFGTQSQLKLFPNPTEGEVTIANEGAMEIRIFDVKGKLLKVEQITPVENYSTIDLSRYPQGIYYLHIGKNVYKVVRK